MEIIKSNNILCFSMRFHIKISTVVQELIIWLWWRMQKKRKKEGAKLITTRLFINHATS